MSMRWGIKWHVGILWKDCFPWLFRTREQAREAIEKEYGYIKTREDLRRPPHNWRLPKAVKLDVILKEIK